MGYGVLVGMGVGDWTINGVGTGVLVGIGNRVAVAVGGSETWDVGAGVGVGSDCSHASSATASTRLNTKIPSKDAVLDCTDIEMKLRARPRKGLDWLIRINR